MKKKLLNKKGFTLVEVLIATAILAIFVSMAVVGTTALFGTGEKMMNVSKAAVLGSDVMKAVTNEVRFGENFSYDETDGTLISYDSASYGNNCKMQKSEDGKLVVVNTASSTDSFGGTNSSEKTFYPIGSAAYDEVYIKSITFSIVSNKTSVAVTCSLSITSDGANTLWENSVTLVPLYQKAV